VYCTVLSPPGYLIGNQYMLTKALMNNNVGDSDRHIDHIAAIILLRALGFEKV